MLVVADGPSRRVGPGGILIGRDPECDIVATSANASRRQALVRLAGDGAEIVPLGRAPVEINGKPAARVTALAHGDAIRLPGGMMLTVELVHAGEERAAPFQIARKRGGRFGIVHSPFAVGGGEADDLVMKEWPDGALYFYVAAGELSVEVRAETATLNGVELATESVEPLVIGDELAYRDELFAIDRPRGRQMTTVGESLALPRRVSVEMLPRGGRVVFDMPSGEHAVHLADRRLDLVIALLRPPAGYRAGDFIPDDVVRTVVWPRNPGVSRPEINMLISRCRRDLVQAGLPGPRLLERAPAGGGTRLQLAEDAQVVVC
jgi:hypothetical protein